MIFVDEARIQVKAGDGGQGCESFFRDKGMRHPRPDGGDGGCGGDVIFVADRAVHTLLDFKYKQHFKAGKGGNASSKGKKGKDGKPIFLRVPVGTLIREHATGLLIRDLTQDQEEVLVAQGGKPGIGNMNRKTVKSPGPGEQRIIDLELKLIADVGLVGFPNAGKSTLINKISRVRSKVAGYPFTTKTPILGVVDVDKEGEESHFIVADLPGLIEGAHQGRGLGDRFLRHAERTKILVHMLDMAGTEGRDPLDDFEKISLELREYSDELSFKHKIIVANKMDLPPAQKNIRRFRQQYGQDVFEISALNQKGLDALIEEIRQRLCIENSQDL